jgi:glucuronate isomerase
MSEAMFSEDLYLTSGHAKQLYEAYAKDLPIIDYHCHLSPKEIYEDGRFEDLGEIWLAHDHYKWRAMRAFGIDESLITGDAPYRDKFLAFAGILPSLAGNPLHVWCALELKRYFGIDEPLGRSNAADIYEKTKAMIAEQDMRPSHFIARSNVEFVATTDDPADDLGYHKLIAESAAYKNRKIAPAFRPDKALNAEKPGFAAYLEKLGNAADVDIADFRGLILALERRLKYFKKFGPSINDNAVTQFAWADYTASEVDSVFQKARRDEPLAKREIDVYRSAFLFEMTKLYAKHGSVTQLHIGASRDVNSVMFKKLGSDSGYDGVDEPASVRSVATLLDRANSAGALPKMIFYPLDINQCESFAILAAIFCGGERGKLQLGAPWWFNDQAYGIARQFESVSCLYPIALSVGMLTDSRSFLSYPRHELYRRLLCSYFGTLLERGEYCSGEQELGAIVKDICYFNAKAFFGI